MKNPCEVVAYAMHSSGKTSLAVGLSPYKIAKIDDLASKLAGRLFSLFCMACSVHKFFTKIISTRLLTVLTTGDITKFVKRNQCKKQKVDLFQIDVTSKEQEEVSV